MSAGRDRDAPEFLDKLAWPNALLMVSEKFTRAYLLCDLPIYTNTVIQGSISWKRKVILDVFLRLLFN